MIGYGNYFLTREWNDHYFIIFFFKKYFPSIILTLFLNLPIKIIMYIIIILKMENFAVNIKSSYKIKYSY